jgi:hypothetical protein
MKALVAALICGAVAAPLLAAEPIKEGRWQYTMQMEMPNMPKVEMPANVQLPPGMKLPQMGPKGMTMNYERCVTKDDLVPRNDKGRDNCTVTKKTQRGNSVDWAVSCDTPHGKMQGAGTATYSGDTMNSKMHLTGTDDRGQPIDVTQNVSGRYLGACTQ